MKGLLLKDFYNVKNLILYYALVAAVFAVVSVVSSNIYFFCGFMIFISVGLVSSTISYDAQDKWDRSCLSRRFPTHGGLVEVCFYSRNHTLFAGARLDFGVGARVSAGGGFSAGRRLFLCGRVKRRHRPALFFPFRRGKGARHLHDRHCFHRCVDGWRHFFVRAVEFCRAGAWMLVLLAVLSVAILAISYFVSLRIYRNKEFN